MSCVTISYVKGKLTDFQTDLTSKWTHGMRCRSVNDMYRFYLKYFFDVLYVLVFFKYNKSRSCICTVIRDSSVSIVSILRA